MDHGLVSSARAHSSHASKRSMWRRSVAAGSALTLAGGLMLMAGTSASAGVLTWDTTFDTSEVYVGANGGDTLGAAEDYAVLAEAAATVPNNTLWGYLDAAAAITDPGTTFCGTVNDDKTAADGVKARNDARSAYDNLKLMPTYHPMGDLTNDDLGGQTVYPGVYFRSAAIAVSSQLTFDALGDSSAVFVIKTDAALNSTAGTVVKLAGGALAKNIFWVVPAATTLGAGSTFYGRILSHAAVTVGAGSILDGQAFSLTAAVTLGDAVDAGPGHLDSNGAARRTTLDSDGSVSGTDRALRRGGDCTPTGAHDPNHS